MKPRVETLTLHRIFDPEKKCIGNVSSASSTHVCASEKCAGDACFSPEKAGMPRVILERSHAPFCGRLVFTQRRQATSGDLGKCVACVGIA
ncbi:hypothetical protein [Xanthomonas sp. SS]|uniref:hypothetical protein n=1 Tax=Xanthomonas sp. SS TaxID=2724122 RepID=UPI00163A1735|nr:hypothetical protein [Xanthomonas sp. SS]